MDAARNGDSGAATRCFFQPLLAGSLRLVLAAGFLLTIVSAPGLARAEGARASPKPPSAAVEHIERTFAEGILGQPVLDEKGATIGRIVDILIDTLGDPQAAIVEFAGFLGVGNRKVAVAWSALRFSVKGDHIVIKVALDATKLRAMPEYRPSAASVPVAVPVHPSPAGPGEPR